MRRTFQNLVVVTLLLGTKAFALEKAFKGEAPTQKFHLGAMGGIGVVDSRVGASFQATAAVKVLDRGFADDINNQLFIEGQFGPLFIAGGAAFQYSCHLRWDFIKDLDWTFYGLGGLGGVVTGTSYSPIPAGPSSASSLFYPRFGIGALWGLFEMVSLRAELSHEFIGFGAIVLL